MKRTLRENSIYGKLIMSRLGGVGQSGESALELRYVLICNLFKQSE